MQKNHTYSMKTKKIYIGGFDMGICASTTFTMAAANLVNENSKKENTDDSSKEYVKDIIVVYEDGSLDTPHT